jgi:hypothetical protein
MDLDDIRFSSRSESSPENGTTEHRHRRSFPGIVIIRDSSPRTGGGDALLIFRHREQSVGLILPRRSTKSTSPMFRLPLFKKI